MPRRREPTARQARLGAELLKLRDAAGLSGREAAALLGTDAARLSQIESGVGGVSEDTVRRVAANYSCADAELIEALVAMATDRSRGWWEEYRGKLPIRSWTLPSWNTTARFGWTWSSCTSPAFSRLRPTPVLSSRTESPSCPTPTSSGGFVTEWHAR